MDMFTFTHFYFFDDTFSLAQGIFHLYHQGEYSLFVLLFSFSIAMPLIKMLLLLYNINCPPVSHGVMQRRLNRLSQIGKWSMLDVFVIAIVAVTIKLGMIAEITIHRGLILFALGVVLSMLLPMLITYLKPPLRIVTNDIERHNYLILGREQLQQLSSNGEIIIGVTDNIAQPNDYLDIFDTDEQWQAKVTVTSVTLEQKKSGYNLTITLI